MFLAEIMALLPKLLRHQPQIFHWVSGRGSCIDAPIYIKELLIPLNSIRTLLSSTKNLLKVPKSRTKTYGDRVFSVTGPILWNKLPDELRHELSLNSFKSKLKTFFFKHFYE